MQSNLEILKTVLDDAPNKGTVYATCSDMATSMDKLGPVWTVGPDPNSENWSTDSGSPGYGLMWEDAKLYAAARNALPLMLAVVEAAERHVNSESNATFQPLQEALAAFNAANLGVSNG